MRRWHRQHASTRNQNGQHPVRSSHDACARNTVITSSHQVSSKSAPQCPLSERSPSTSPVGAGCPKPTQKPVRGTHYARKPGRHDACHHVSASCSSTHAPSLPADRLPRWLAHRSEAVELSSCAPSKSARLLTQFCWATSGLPSSRDTESTTSRARHKTYLNPIDMPMLFHYHAGS
jgi:hypothetical protein